MIGMKKRPAADSPEPISADKKGADCLPLFHIVADYFWLLLNHNLHASLLLQLIAVLLMLAEVKAHQFLFIRHPEPYHHVYHLEKD
jgi:hypothetical protein